MSAGLPLVAGINFGDAVQYVQSSCLPCDVGMVIVLRQHRTRVISAVFCCDLLQLIEKLFQFSPSEPIEQVADLLCWSERLVPKRHAKDNKSGAVLL
jgi:hypothetical protein